MNLKEKVSHFSIYVIKILGAFNVEVLQFSKFTANFSTLEPFQDSIQITILIEM